MDQERPLFLVSRISLDGSFRLFQSDQQQQAKRVKSSFIKQVIGTLVKLVRRVSVDAKQGGGDEQCAKAVKHHQVHWGAGLRSARSHLFLKEDHRQDFAPPLQNALFRRHPVLLAFPNWTSRSTGLPQFDAVVYLATHIRQAHESQDVKN